MSPANPSGVPQLDTMPHPHCLTLRGHCRGGFHTPCPGRLDFLPTLYVHFPMPVLAIYPPPQSLLLLYLFSKLYPESFSFYFIMESSQSSQTDVIPFPDLHSSFFIPLPFWILLRSCLHISVCCKLEGPGRQWHVFVIHSAPPGPCQW